jgi:hypothetical protein
MWLMARMCKRDKSLARASYNRRLYGCSNVLIENRGEFSNGFGKVLLVFRPRLT